MMLKTINHQSLNIQHNGSSFIKILDEPLEMPHSSTYNSLRLQDISMLDFQSRISMVFRAIARDKGVRLPLRGGEYGVEILLKSKRSNDDLSLLETTKAIIDGINSEVIENDAAIFHVKVRKVNKSIKVRAKNKPSDELDVSIKELNANRSALDFAGLTTHLSLKKSPYLIDGVDAELFYPHIELIHYDISEALRVDGFNIVTSIGALKMCFEGSVISKDLDNMAKTYTPILNELHNDYTRNIEELELIKIPQSKDKANVSISLK
ncbi:hypothetical protein [Tenuibacillus multivorans]|uniref:Uncharacterized protein n=1 Tax=Tenuibacillus multivorans TaxID=237069 RepID=A0A1G9YL56_9BACI|nr:hypothetical protein [Tenuibacillus multivorans]GEL78681.1 hypothetical protein TMU01_29160 [Tenuibacillus multivorans]SDN09235.1 hypothetical protein SAMN05216498_1437 [Tenuibacillus multivorans]